MADYRKDSDTRNSLTPMLSLSNVLGSPLSFEQFQAVVGIAADCHLIDGSADAPRRFDAREKAEMLLTTEQMVAFDMLLTKFRLSKCDRIETERRQHCESHAVDSRSDHRRRNLVATQLLSLVRYAASGAMDFHCITAPEIGRCWHSARWRCEKSDARNPRGSWRAWGCILCSYIIRSDWLRTRAWQDPCLRPRAVRPVCVLLQAGKAAGTSIEEFPDTLAFDNPNNFGALLAAALVVVICFAARTRRQLRAPRKIGQLWSIASGASLF